MAHHGWSIVVRALILICVVVLTSAAATAARQAQGASPVTVWDGVYTEAQAERGRGQYGAHCSSCHGTTLQGGEAKALSGARFWASWQETTVDYLLRQVSQNMPFTDDGSLAGTLGPSVYADIVAHILKSNGFPAGARELSAESSGGVAIVPQDGSRDLPADAAARVVGCLARTEKGEWQLINASRPTRVLAGSTSTDTALGDRTITLRFVLTPLQKYAGHRMAASGLLIGEGGSGGLNVSEIASISPTCD